MNHDNAHCLDYGPDCPQRCFRAKLTHELKSRSEYLGLPVSWMHFKGTKECLVKRAHCRHCPGEEVIRVVATRRLIFDFKAEAEKAVAKAISNQLVHCADCRYWNQFPSSSISPDYHDCERHVGIRFGTRAFDFCSYGEHREEEEDEE